MHFVTSRKKSPAEPLRADSLGGVAHGVYRVVVFVNGLRLLIPGGVFLPCVVAELYYCVGAAFVDDDFKILQPLDPRLDAPRAFL